MKQIAKKQGGFTLIEVVLVLAIGALIILMGVLAYNGAQRSRRDTARTNLTGTISAAVEQFAANAGGAYPTAAEFNTLVTSSGWKDPKGTPNPVAGTAPAGTHGIVYVPATNCASSTTTSVAATGYSIFTSQESGQKACTDNTK